MARKGYAHFQQVSFYPDAKTSLRDSNSRICHKRFAGEFQPALVNADFVKSLRGSNVFSTIVLDQSKHEMLDEAVT
jgi:hypothetical protein